MKVIIINGPMGSGKTAAGKYIAEHNEGTAFIDGDWCMDLHPFVGNGETRAMAADNILYMISNYSRCSACRMIVLVWLMDDRKVYDSIINGISAMGLDIRSVTLVCSEDVLKRRWRNDKSCEWRTDSWLEVSIRSLPYFRVLEHTIDTDDMTVAMTADAIIAED